MQKESEEFKKYCAARQVFRMLRMRDNKDPDYAPPKQKKFEGCWKKWFEIKYGENYTTYTTRLKEVKNDTTT